MKLLATVNNTHAVFSVSHHDCNLAHGLMADGGQPGLQNYAGYTRSNAQMVWIELPGVNFADLYNDYNQSHFPDRSRKYGAHPIADVKILSDEERPDVDSFEWKKENYIWGTSGKSGNEPLKFIRLMDAETSHLQAILDNCPHASLGIIPIIINSILNDRLSPVQK